MHHARIAGEPPQRRSRLWPAQARRARWSAATLIIAAGAALSSCASSSNAGSAQPAARYVGAAPDTCHYVSAAQVAAVTGRNVTRVRPEQQPNNGGRGCSYDLGDSATDLSPQWVGFTYFRGIGEQGFEHWADAGELVPGLGAKAMWGSATLTVLTRQSDVVVVDMQTWNGNLAQAEQIFHLAAPKLRAASAPAPFTAAQLRFLAWYNGGGISFDQVRVTVYKLFGDMRFNRAAVQRDALALQSYVATALNNPSPIDLADYKAAILDAAGVARDALRHVPVDQQFLAAYNHIDAFEAAMQHEIATINSS